MALPSLEKFYHDRKLKFSYRLQEVQKSINVISNLRLLTAAAFLILLYVAFQNYAVFYILPLVVIAFVLLMQRHSRAFDERVRLENLVRINENEGKSLAGDYASLFSGASFVDPKHPYSHDLDLFGDIGRRRQ